MHGILLHGFRRPREEQHKGEADLDFPGALAAQTGCECSKGAQLMQKLEFSSYTLANGSLWRTHTGRGRQCVQALAIAGEHIMFHGKTRRLTSWVPLSILRYLRWPSASCVLLAEPEKTGVNGDIYESTHTHPWNVICF